MTRQERHERQNVAEGRRWYAPRCGQCDRALTDRDARHGYQTCAACAPGHVPEGSRYRQDGDA